VTLHALPRVGFARWRRARLILPTLLVAAALAGLVALGNWQLERRAWKQELLDRIAARTAAPQVPLAEALRQARAGVDVEYLRVAVTGRFDHAGERHVYALDAEGQPGFHIYTPLTTGDRRVVLVNRGYVPLAQRDPKTRQAGQIGEVSLVGLARQPRPAGWFAAVSDPQRNLFYWPDFQAIAASLEPEYAAGDLVPFFVEAEAKPANPGGLPRGGVTRLTLPQNHLQYALTWYGLALALLAVYGVFAVGRLAALEDGKGAQRSGGDPRPR
jgi:surfeit locus 1 family protein